MTETNPTPPAADLKTLERLVDMMRKDTASGAGLTYAAVRSIAEIIERAIGAPLSWPSREAGAKAADEYYPGTPTLRHGFNAGVKWAVEHYTPTDEPSRRFG
jgi:hypothetical protein